MTWARVGQGYDTALAALAAGLLAAALLAAEPAAAQSRPNGDAVSAPPRATGPSEPMRATFEGTILKLLRYTDLDTAPEGETMIVEAAAPPTPLTPVLPLETSAPASVAHQDGLFGYETIIDHKAAPYDRARLYLALSPLAGLATYVGATVGLLRDPDTPTHAAVQYREWLSVGPSAGLIYAF